MKTIEERAREFALEKHPYSPFCEEYEKMYIEIATEQKSIDDAEYQKIRKLAYDMYNAAQYLSEDASVLHKAMDKFKEYIVYEEKKG